MPVPELTQYRVYTYDPYFGPQWYFDREAHRRDLAKLAETTRDPGELWEILKEGSDYQDDPSFIQAFLDNPATPPRLLFTLAEARVRQGNSVGYILAHILDRAGSGDEEARKVLQEEQRRYLENSDLFYSYEERWRLFLFRDDQSPLLAKVPELLQGILQDDTTHQSRAYLCAVILAEALAGDHALDPETYFLWARALQKLGGDERRKLARLLAKRGGPWLHLALLHNPLAPVSLEDLPPRDRLTVASLSLLYALELAARGYLQAEDLFSLLKTSPETRERWESQALTVLHAYPRLVQQQRHLTVPLYQALHPGAFQRASTEELLTYLVNLNHTVVPREILSLIAQVLEGRDTGRAVWKQDYYGLNSTLSTLEKLGYSHLAWTGAGWWEEFFDQKGRLKKDRTKGVSTDRIPIPVVVGVLARANADGRFRILDQFGPRLPHSLLAHLAKTDRSEGVRKRAQELLAAIRYRRIEQVLFGRGVVSRVYRHTIQGPSTFKPRLFWLRKGRAAVVVQAASLHVHWRSDHHAELRLNRPPTGSLAETLAGVLEIPVVVVEAPLKHPEAELEHLLDLRRIYDNAPRKAKVSWREFCIPWIARYLPPDLLRLADKHLLARDLVNL